jgi:hypothetical protein
VSWHVWVGFAAGLLLSVVTAPVGVSGAVFMNDDVVISIAESARRHLCAATASHTATRHVRRLDVHDHATGTSPHD